MNNILQSRHNAMFLKTHLRVNEFGKNRQRLLSEIIDSTIIDNIKIIIRGDKKSLAARSLSMSSLKVDVEFVTGWNKYDISSICNNVKGLLFVDGSIQLRPDAVGEFAFAFYKGADLIYADECVTPVTHEEDCFYKPGWSPELLYTFQYIGPVFLVSKQLFVKIGGFGDFDGPVSLHNFLLRIRNSVQNVIHIPRILFSSPRGHKVDNGVVTAAKKIVEGTLAKVGLAAKVFFTEKLQPNGTPTFRLSFPGDGPSVAIMIASRNNLSLLLACLKSLKKTTYWNYKVYVVDNESDDPEMLDWLKTASYQVISVDRPHGKFNFAHIYNSCIPQASEEFILLLNSDIEVISPTWLSDMMGYAQLPGVGSVGARLIFGDGTVQHCGIYHNVNHGFPGTAFRHMPHEEDGYWQLSRLSCNHMAETAACVLTSKKMYLEQGGLDEQRFGVAFNDCDYGYRLHAAGYRNVFCPTAELYHLENATRGGGDSVFEEAAYITHYKQQPEAYYNPNFTKGDLCCALSSRTLETIPVRPFRLLMVMHDLTRTGACRNACLIATALKERGTIIPIVLSHLDGPLRPMLENAGIEVHIMPHFFMLQSESETHLQQYLEEMAGWVKALAPDVVYGNTILTFWAMGAAHKLGLPCVWNIRESEEPFSHLDEHSPVVKPFAKECMKYPYQVVFVADATKDLFTPFFNGGNAITIHNGFDRAYFSNCCNHITREEARRQLGLKDDTVYILCVGTICERKGQFDIFDAIRGLDLDSLKKCHLGLVGGDVETDYKKSILATLQTLPQEQRAHITIYNSPGNIDFHYRAADIFICSSRIESFPRTIQEAMSCDLPIITTPVFGIVEQVRNNVSALFYDPGDIVKLQELIKLLMFDAEKRRELGTQAGMALDILPSTVDMINAYETVFKEAWLSA